MAYHHGDLPRALVEVSVALIRDRGLDAFSLRAAARAVGVAPAAVYRHFADRDALLSAVAATGFAALADAMRAATDGVPGPAARFAAVGDAYVRFAVDRPEFFRVMFTRRSATSADGAYAQLLAALGDLDLAVAVDAAAVVAWSAVHGLAALVVDGVLDLAGLDARIAAVTATVVRGLSDQTGSPWSVEG